MRAKLPSTLITKINRLANEEMRREVWARAKNLRSEYTARADAGESIEDIASEVHIRTAKAAAGIGL